MFRCPSCGKQAAETKKQSVCRKTHDISNIHSNRPYIFSPCLSYDIVMPDIQSRHQKTRRKFKKNLKITVSSDKRLSTVTQRRLTHTAVSEKFSYVKCVQISGVVYVTCRYTPYTHYRISIYLLKNVQRSITI